MGVSTDGEISFGVPLAGASEEFMEYWADPESWWLNKQGWESSYRKELDDYYAHGKRPPRELFDDYWAERKAALRETGYEDYGLTVVNYCSGEYPELMLAIKKSNIQCRRGYPQHIDIQALVEMDKKKDAWAKTLTDFLATYFPDEEIEAKPGWYLTSYWG